MNPLISANGEAVWSVSKREILKWDTETQMAHVVFPMTAKMLIPLQERAEKWFIKFHKGRGSRNGWRVTTRWQNTVEWGVSWPLQHKKEIVVYKISFYIQ